MTSKNNLENPQGNENGVSLNEGLEGDYKYTILSQVSEGLLEDHLERDVSRFIEKVLKPLIKKHEKDKDPKLLNFYQRLNEIVSNFEKEQALMSVPHDGGMTDQLHAGNGRKTRHRVDAGVDTVKEDSIEHLRTIEELDAFAKATLNNVDEYRNQLDYGNKLVQTSPRHKALNAVFQMKMKAGVLTKALKKMKSKDESVADNQASINAMLKYISKQEDIVKNILALPESEIDAPEPTVEFHLEGRRGELQEFEKTLKEFLTKYPTSADTPDMKVLQDNLKKTEVLAENTENASNSSVLWKMASELDSLKRQLAFLESTYSAPEQIADTRQSLKEKMQEAFAGEDESLVQMSRELFDLLGENETNLEEFGLYSSQTKEVNDKYTDILGKFDERYRMVQHEFERSQVQEIIDYDNKAVVSSYEELRDKIAGDEKLKTDQKTLLSKQLMAARALYLTQTEGYLKEPTETDVQNALLQWKSTLEALSQYVSVEGVSDIQEPLKIFRDRISEVDSPQKIDAIEAGILEMNAEIAKGPQLAEKLPALDMKRSGWKKKFIDIASGLLNKLTISVASAGVMYAAVSSEVPEEKLGIGASSIAVASTNEVPPTVDEYMGTGGLEGPVVQEQSPVVSETIDSVPMTDISPLPADVEKKFDSGMEKQPVEFIFQEGNKTNTISEALLKVWRQNPNVLGKNVSDSVFQAAMWAVIADVEKNQSQEDVLGLAMGLEKHNGVYDIGHVHTGGDHKIDLRAFYQLINERI